MPTNSTAREVAHAVREQLHNPDMDLSTPQWMRGMLASSGQQISNQVQIDSSSTPSQHLIDGIVTETSAVGAVSRIVARSEQGKLLRTNASVLQAFTASMQRASTTTELYDAANELPGKLQGTGVYKAVEMTLSPSVTSPSQYDVDLCLDENSFSLQAGLDQSMSGKATAGTELRLLNRFGWAETLAVRIGRVMTETDFPQLTELGFPAARNTAAVAVPLASTGSTLKASLPPQSFAQSINSWSATSWKRITSWDPDFRAEARFPVIAGHLCPLTLHASRESADFSAQSSFTVRTSGGEISITDPSNSHSLTAAVGYRDPRPMQSADAAGGVRPLASREVLDQMKPTVKSSLSYSFLAGRLMGPDAGGDAGRRVIARVELAGGPLGGDVSFLKGHVTAYAAASFFRYTRDTGYIAPLHQSAWLEDRLNAAAGSGRSGEEGDWRRLLPHPGPLSLFPWLADTYTRAHMADNYTAWHRLAGWASGGVTAQVEGSAGCAVPLPWSTGAGVGVLDRFQLNHPRIKGMDALGPRGAAVLGGGGVAGGDVLGGTAMLAMTARVLLPPPVPSVRIAASGLRSSLWTTVAYLGEAHAPGTLVDPVHWAAAAGVGLTMPLSAGMAIDAEWGLGYAIGGLSGGAARKFRLGLNM